MSSSNPSFQEGTAADRSPDQQPPIQKSPDQKSPNQQSPNQHFLTQLSPYQQPPTQQSPTQKSPKQQSYIEKEGEKWITDFIGQRVRIQSAPPPVLPKGPPGRAAYFKHSVMGRAWMDPKGTLSTNRAELRKQREARNAEAARKDARKQAAARSKPTPSTDKQYQLPSSHQYDATGQRQEAEVNAHLDIDTEENPSPTTSRMTRKMTATRRQSESNHITGATSTSTKSPSTCAELADLGSRTRMTRSLAAAETSMLKESVALAQAQERDTIPSEPSPKRPKMSGSSSSSPSPDQTGRHLNKSSERSNDGETTEEESQLENKRNGNKRLDGLDDDEDEEMADDDDNDGDWTA